MAGTLTHLPPAPTAASRNRSTIDSAPRSERDLGAPAGCVSNAFDPEVSDACVGPGASVKGVGVLHFVVYGCEGGGVESDDGFELGRGDGSEVGIEVGSDCFSNVVKAEVVQETRYQRTYAYMLCSASPFAA